MSHVVAVNGNLVSVVIDDTKVMQNEVGYVCTDAGEKLCAEIIRIEDKVAHMQVFESTRGLKKGSMVTFEKRLLSVLLGPGILGQIFDGLQNPLEEIAKQNGFFLKRGAQAHPLDLEKKWDFIPTAKIGDQVKAGISIGWVREGIFEHKIMIPFYYKGTFKVSKIQEPGSYSVNEVVAEIQKGDETHAITMIFDWPVKMAIKAYKKRTVSDEQLITKCRIIDTCFPISKGRTFCIPGPFGAGKTVLQQTISRYAEVDIVIVAACGERAGEIVETLKEFPELTDPKTGKSLMERTIIIANTSSMPVAAREASVYTAITLGEYYRQMGLNVLLLADSTSRWAQALREMSGRLEEIPGEEAFPAYLSSRIAEFYERAGCVELYDGTIGSLTIGGTVSPAGGNFEEPVTQATLAVVDTFLGLTWERSNARKFPAIDPIISWSKCKGISTKKDHETLLKTIEKGINIKEMMTVVGEEGTTMEDFIIFLKAEFADRVYLQQNAYDDVDIACCEKRQLSILKKVISILDKPMNFKNKEGARSFFQKIQQIFIDWHSIVFESEEFYEKEKYIEEVKNESNM